MAVDIKSLRIGSHILVNGARARVSKIIDPPLGRVMPGIELLHFNAVIDGNICECGCPACADGAEPIPITPELLKELGFEKEAWPEYDDMIAYEKKTGNAKVRIEINTTDVYGAPITAFCRCWHMPTAYLHELEQFVYAITQDELIED